ncbi:MAG: cation transporter, partial [Spirochaetes bacterium]|nr:cation transporter [Spirochaetota bacterium]
MKSDPTSLRTRYGYIEGWLSIILNTLLFALKYWAGLASGSVAIIADAWHTLSDSLTSIVVLVGIRISADPADDRHPYGHGRAELIGSIIIGVLLAVVAFNFVADSVEKLIDRESARYGTLAIAATAASVVLKEILAQVALRMGKKTNAQSLIADGWHHRSDAISSLVILAGIFAGRYLWWIDAAMGIAVSLVILYAAWGILKRAASSLIGEEADPDLAGTINAIA